MGTPQAADPRWAPSWLGRLGAYVPALVVAIPLGLHGARAILEKAGRPAMPLDDSFIHLVYARALAEGRPLEYVAGLGPTSGATSLLWPALLAPAYALGLDGLDVVYVAWALGTLLHAAVAVETSRLARPLAGPVGALGAGALALSFGAFAWFARSGMETMLFTWLLARAARTSARLFEPDARHAPSSSARAWPGPALDVALAGALCPLARPEGALGAGLALAALVLAPLPPFEPHGSRRRRLALAALPALGVAVVPLVNLALVGHAASSTTLVKWLPANPAYDRATLLGTIFAHVRLLTGNLLAGGEWTHIFVPEGSFGVLVAGAVALALAAKKTERPAHALAVVAVCLGSLAPTTFLSFLWNRVRYLWPFAPAWFVLVACLASTLGGLFARALPRSLALGPSRSRASVLTALLLGGAVGLLASKLGVATADLAQSAYAIDRQQVRLGEWAARALPRTARVGVNDTGAIAYVSRLATFDVVGLTTEGEARYWVAGAGSRFEHYERLPRERLPTHFIVYPEWMGAPAVLGEVLTSATVLDQSILGGPTMVAYEARWDLLGSGERPFVLPASEAPVDALDVADLESEAAHGYDAVRAFDVHNRAGLFGVGSLVEEGQALAALPAHPDGLFADGGRIERSSDRFTLHLPSAGRLVLRVASEEPTRLSVQAGEALATVELPGGGALVERVVRLEGAGEGTPITVRAEHATFEAYHYWAYR
jgi:hypothetical protein